MRILIFGGGGFVGLNIAEAALAAGHTVTLFDRALPQQFRRQLRESLVLHREGQQVVDNMLNWSRLDPQRREMARDPMLR